MTLYINGTIETRQCSEQEKLKQDMQRDTRTMRKREEVKPKSVKKHAGPLIDEMRTDASNAYWQPRALVPFKRATLPTIWL